MRGSETRLAPGRSANGHVVSRRFAKEMPKQWRAFLTHHEQVVVSHRVACQQIDIHVAVQACEGSFAIGASLTLSRVRTNTMRSSSHSGLNRISAPSSRRSASTVSSIK